jgi:FKBP-type peptidyl-prolyl cis-trans isomerase
MKKKSFLATFFAVLFVSGTLMLGTSCQGGDKASKFPGYKETETGLIYQFHIDNNDDTTKAVVGKFLDLTMLYGTEDSILFDSRELPTGELRQLPMMASTFQGDLYEGLGMMTAGDSATFMLVADSVWLKLFGMQRVPPGMDSIDYIYFHIALKDVITREEMEARRTADLLKMQEEEEKQMAEYINENYPDAESTETGLYIIKTKEVPRGSTPKLGERVQVHYTGTLLNGTKFDSSVDRGKPYEFPLGQGQVIQGWDEAIATMKVGERAILVIPSDLAYGDRGNNGIPPFSPLVFEVELVDIVDAK